MLLTRSNLQSSNFGLKRTNLGRVDQQEEKHPTCHCLEESPKERWKKRASMGRKSFLAFRHLRQTKKKSRSNNQSAFFPGCKTSEWPRTVEFAKQQMASREMQPQKCDRWQLAYVYMYRCFHIYFDWLGQLFLDWLSVFVGQKFRSCDLTLRVSETKTKFLSVFPNFTRTPTISRASGEERMKILRCSL